jgi:hypothetical protein
MYPEPDQIKKFDPAPVKNKSPSFQKNFKYPEPDQIKKFDPAPVKNKSSSFQKSFKYTIQTKYLTC